MSGGRVAARRPALRRKIGDARPDYDAARHDRVPCPSCAICGYFVGASPRSSASRARPTAAHGRVAAEPGDPPARGRARRRAVRAHDAHVELTDAGRRLLADGVAALHGRVDEGVRQRGAGGARACSARCGSAARPPARYESARRCSRGCASASAGSRSTRPRRRPATSAASCSAAGSTSRSGSAPSRCPGSRGAGRSLRTSAMHVLDAPRTHRLAGAAELRARGAARRPLRGPRRELNAGFNRRLRLLCREPASSRGRSSRPPSGTTPSGRRATSGHAGHRAGRPARARRTCATALLVPGADLPLELVWREDDDSPVLRTFLEVATPRRNRLAGS